MHKVFCILLYAFAFLILTFESASCSFFHHDHNKDHKHKHKHHEKLETFEDEKPKRQNLEHLEELKNMPRHNITPYLLEKEGYPCETHTIMTEDGYYVTMHRIPHGKPGNGSELGNNSTISNQNHTGVKKPVVLLLHGFMACDECWLINAPDRNLPFILANKNYDVWLGNLRGCFYSKNHTTIPINSTAFWNFGFHEQGKYDLPAMTDYILNVTGQKKINLIGHSMGTTVIYVMLSVRPEYNEKINMSICLAPVAYMSHVTSPTVRASAFVFHLLRNNTFLDDFLFRWNLPFWPRNAYTEDQIQNLICKNERAKKWCMASFFLFMGFDYCQMSVDNFDLFTTIYPGGTSASTGLHFEQLVYSKQFQQYDFGPEENLIRYGNVNPPKYNLSNVRAPMTLFFADNDWLANSRDIAKLVSEVHPDSIKESCRVRFRRFNHLDFLVARDVNLLLYNRILPVLEGQSCRHGDDDSDGIDEDIKCNFTEDHDFIIPEEHIEQVQHMAKVVENWLGKKEYFPK